MDSDASQRYVRGFRSNGDTAGRDNGSVTEDTTRAHQNGPDALQGMSHRDAAGDVRRRFRAQNIQGRETLCHGGW